MDMTGEKTKGRKRHIVTDTMGNLLCIHVHAANIHDTKGGIYTFEKALYRYPTVLPKRWVVERAFAWLNGSHRLSKDYETSCCSAETMIMISHAATLLKRL